jgi:hypothetical protein
MTSQLKVLEAVLEAVLEPGLVQAFGRLGGAPGTKAGSCFLRRISSYRMPRRLLLPPPNL